MEVQAAPRWWKAISQADNTWEIRNFGNNKLATVEAGEEAEIHARMFATSSYVAEALALLLTVIGDDELPDNGHYNAEERAGIRDMALAAVKVAMGNEEWNWRFGLGLDDISVG